MAFSAIKASTSAPLTHPIAFPRGQLCRNSHLRMHARNYSTSISCSLKFPIMDHFHDSSSFNMYLNHVKRKILEVVPSSVKSFPWRKAENIMLQQLLILGREALKWSLFAALIFGFISDIIYSISISRELVVPFGLLVGCLFANFVKETSQEFMNISKVFLCLQLKSTDRYLLGAGCFFVLVRSVSMYLPVGGRVFASHAANGGLMQVLWHLKSSLEMVTESRENHAVEDDPFTGDAKD